MSWPVWAAGSIFDRPVRLDDQLSLGISSMSSSNAYVLASLNETLDNDPGDLVTRGALRDMYIDEGDSDMVEWLTFLIKHEKWPMICPNKAKPEQGFHWWSLVDPEYESELPVNNVVPEWLLIHLPDEEWFRMDRRDCEEILRKAWLASGKLEG